MQNKLRFVINRLEERLWVKPLLVCIVSVAVAFVAQMFDRVALLRHAPEVNPESITVLLEVISSSMLVMAVFAVGSMLAAYQSASKSGTPRSFSLVVSDDVSQNALSTFIGAFIFSIVAQVAMLNGYYEKAGTFILFIITVLVFVLVIFSFIKWVDSIARLGLLGTVIKKVEVAATAALLRRRDEPFLGGVEAEPIPDSAQREGHPLFTRQVGYIQRVDLACLQVLAEEGDLRITLAAVPGDFVTGHQPLAYICEGKGARSGEAMDEKALLDAFAIDNDRTFDEDPGFGLTALSEIASRALSPAVHDPGTAIEITDILVRLFSAYGNEKPEQEKAKVDFDRIAVPALSHKSLFDLAFSAISRDGAGCIEVVERTLKALATLADLGNDEMAKAAVASARLTVAHAEAALKVPAEVDKLHAASAFLR